MPGFGWAGRILTEEDDTVDLAAIIQEAKLGRERKAAQEDTCSVFAGALMDVLAEQGIAAEATTASFFLLPGGRASWHHAVVKVGIQFFDSMGEITHEIVRARTKIHQKVSSRLDFRPDARDDLEEEFVELHAFLVEELRRAFAAHARSAAIEHDVREAVSPGM